jgi:hypothetical protein
MSVFISYNQNDEEFVERLSLALIKNHVPVWRDKWQIGLGESITNSVQAAMEKASFVCLVLSKNALQSKWVEREITASLVRELEKKEVFILPIVIDDCTVPLFLRDKLYADFRKDFDAGVKMILNAVAKKYNLFAGRITNEGKSTSFGTDVIIYERGVEINLDVVNEDDDANYFILTKIKFSGDEKMLEKYKDYASAGKAGDFIWEMVKACTEIPEIVNKRVVIGGEKPPIESFTVSFDTDNLLFRMDAVSKKVGQDDGKYVVFPLGAVLQLYVGEPI